MEYRRLGRAGVRVSVIGLGTNRFGTAQLPLAEVSNILDAASWVLTPADVDEVNALLPQSSAHA